MPPVLPVLVRVRVAQQQKKRRECVSLLLGYPDSNQERQDQNLQCYHYTIAQYFAQKRCKDTAFLRNANFLAYFLY